MSQTDYQADNSLHGDTTYGVVRPNYVYNTGVQNLSTNMEFFTVSTKVDIRTAAQSGGSTQSQMNLNKLLEIVSLRGQPIIMGAVTVNGSSVYSIPLVTEHAGAWANSSSSASPIADARSGEDLKARLIADGVNYGFGANVNSVDDTASLAVTFNSPQVLT
jgi:hypothetical protein